MGQFASDGGQPGKCNSPPVLLHAVIAEQNQCINLSLQQMLSPSFSRQSPYKPVYKVCIWVASLDGGGEKRKKKWMHKKQKSQWRKQASWQDYAVSMAITQCWRFMLYVWDEAMSWLERAHTQRKNNQQPAGVSVAVSVSFSFPVYSARKQDKEQGQETEWLE